MLFAGRFLFAQQLGHYIGGFIVLENGSSAPPGFYAAAFGLVEPVDSMRGVRPHKLFGLFSNIRYTLSISTVPSG